MKITYVARKVNLRDNFKERVEQKLNKFSKIFSDNAEAVVVVTLEKNRQTVEITIKDNSMVFRAESTMTEMNDALDKVIDLISGQLRKHKTRLSKRIRTGSIDDLMLASAEEDVTMDDEETLDIVRRKQIPLKPVSVEEAREILRKQFYRWKWSDISFTCSLMPTQISSMLFISEKTAPMVF